MKIELPLPPSDNRRFIVAKYINKFVLSKEHRQYKNVTGIIAKSQWKNPPLKLSYNRQLIIDYIVYLPDKRRDGSNVEKVLKDTLSGVIYDDDKWVCMRLQKIVIDKNNPRVEIIIDDIKYNQLINGVDKL